MITRKEEIQTRIEEILKSHESVFNDLIDGYRVVITLIKDNPIRVEVTKQINIEGRKSGIRITHDGQTDEFSSQKALLYAIEQIGCERFFNAQKRSKVISKERPANVKDNQIVEMKDDSGHWYVYVHSGIAQRVTFLNNIFKALNLDWTAERN
ncbi:MULTISPECIES: hypothetical protein [unclassified Prevotella]|uniref:hypothetical protein n=1 Tax=unclassified Prevotella TaxID=2638335 RepID=UPI000B978214|nr:MULTISPECIES: hypothetical protein [unclassified Prevotella]OYP66531.1 hypothetical protein CIK87_10700 [Prevotella sp. P5-64]OYP71471.1 hypothetical protein CIK92_08255 [Prevotella sp. P4-67]